MKAKKHQDTKGKMVVSISQPSNSRIHTLLKKK